MSDPRPCTLGEKEKGEGGEADGKMGHRNRRVLSAHL